MIKSSFTIAFFLWIFLGFISSISAQFLTVPPNGGNKKAIVGERIGLTDITISYNRPGVKGREGKIWGDLVPYGFTDLGFGLRTPAPWRAGANENTTISFSTDVKIEGKPLNAGTYGLHIAVYEKECTIIFSKNSTAWGSYFYRETEDALRVNVKQVMQEKSTEWLKYEFINQTDNSAVVALLWEKWQIPFKVEVDVVNTVLLSMRRELQNEKGFVWQSWYQAADFCLRNNTNLEEGLQWIETSISGQYIGEPHFLNMETKAKILTRLGRKTEADVVMQQAIPLATMTELHDYGRQLLSEKRTKEALAIFKLNAEKNKGAWPTNLGLAWGYSANGDFSNAIKYAKLALSQAEPSEKTKIEAMIAKYQEKKM
jgi:tetratricopeptide (TPR) repeat protein